MNLDKSQRPFGTLAEAPDAVGIDLGLRSHMLSIYNRMTAALAITGIVAWLVGNIPALTEIVVLSPLRWVFLLAPIGIVLFLSAKLRDLSAATAKTLLWTFAATMGASLGGLFLTYTGESITLALFVSAASFAGLSLYGYSSKTDLSGMGSFLIMGVIGLIIAGIVNVFMRSPALEFVISAAGVLVFAGLTAYDTQKLKEAYSSSAGADDGSRLATIGALELYLDFINLFLYLLRFLGVRKD